MILGLDLGINRTGWCYGDGSVVPEVGCWLFAPTGDDLGELGFALNMQMDGLIAGRPLRAVVYEAPIIVPRRDKLLFLRKILGMGMVLETWCRACGVQVVEESFAKIKRELTGDASADKAAMVRVAEKVGIRLPETIEWGREDAADGFAAWLVGIRHYAKEHLPAWDQRVWGPRGAML